MPPLSVVNQGRKQWFIQNLIAPFLPKVPANLDSKQWDHLTEKANPRHDVGFTTVKEDPRIAWLYQKIAVEADRLRTLSDIRVILDEAPYVEGVCDKFAQWATVDAPRITFQGNSAKRAEQVVNDMLDRIEYSSLRSDYLYNGLFLECFLKKQLSFVPGVENALTASPQSLMAEFMSGGKLGQIDGLLMLAGETMFRNSDGQDLFKNPQQAFYQVPEPYNNPNIPVEQVLYKEWFHQMQMIHPRWNNLRQKSQRYSKPWLKPIRKGYNRTELSATDAVVQRHLAATRLLVIYLKKLVESGEQPGASDDEIRNFVDDFVQRYPTGFSEPGTTFITSGANEVQSVGDLNITLSKPADIFMHFEFMSIQLPMHPMLAGFMGGEGGRVTGPLLDQLKKNAEINVAKVNTWEDKQILEPLCYFELALNGIFDTMILFNHDRPSFEAKDVRRKTMMSEVASNIRSRKNYYEEEIEAETGQTWEEYSKDIDDELKRFGPAQPTENINKGISGSNKDSATVPIQGQK